MPQQKLHIITGGKDQQPVKNLEKDYFPWITENEEKEKKAALNHLVHCIERYRELEFIQCCANAGFESTNETVYELLEQTEWQDRVLEYKHQCQKWLKMLANPKVSSCIKEEGFYVHALVNMVDRLFDFFQSLDMHPYHTLMLSHNLKSFG